MRAQDQTEHRHWRDGNVPVSALFDDPYFSLAGGLAETRHVFLAGNGLPGRLRSGFAIAELGFGTGLNLLATALAAQDCAPPVRYTSFEAWPMPTADMARALSAFPELAGPAQALLAAWGSGAWRFDLGPLRVEIITGDARDTLPRWPGRADAWYLDGFSPARNPEMWGGPLMAEVHRHTAPGGTFATYTAAGAVRRGLQAAGFEVMRVPGFGAKRHMTTGKAPAT